MKKKIVLTLISFISSLFLLSIPVFSIENSANYSVSITPTSNQIDGTTGYFNLRLKKNSMEKLPITIINKSSTELTFGVQFNTATTNNNGIVDYTSSEPLLIGAPNINLSDLISIDENEVKVPAYSEKKVYVDVRMPSVSFDGVLLGGVIISEKNVTKENSGTISNKYQYIIAVQVAQNDTKIKSELTGGDVTLKQVNNLPAIDMVIENKTPSVLAKITGTFIIKRKESGSNILSESKKNLSVAPNSSFFLQMLLDEKLPVGTYTYIVTLENADGSWTFSKDFTITSKKSEKLKIAPTDDTKSISFYNDSFIGISLLLILLFIVIILQRKN